MDISSQITAAESTGNPVAKSPTSSALGLGQFIDGTWLDMIKRYRPDLMQGRSRAEILELRKDPDLSRQMTATYAAENEAKLRQAGLPVTPGSTYLMHFAGPTGAVKLMSADPNTPAESILSADAIKANPFLRGRPASWVVDWADKKMAAAATAKPSVGPQPAPPTAVPYLAQTQALDPAFGATEWLRRPSSPNALAPDAVPPFAPSAAAPRVAATPYLDETRRAQQALDNSLPAPGAVPWTLSDRFGHWGSIGGVSGPLASDANGVGSANSSSPAPPTLGGDTLAAASSNTDPSSVRRLSSPMLGIVAPDPNRPSREAAASLGIDSVPIPNSPPGLIGLSPEAVAATPWDSPRRRGSTRCLRRTATVVRTI